MAALARATGAELHDLVRQAPPLPAHVRLRGPEQGLVMVRGRAGGTGVAFNLGEMTVTRCTVQAGAYAGHATVAGRHDGLAELAARLDAALQDPALHDAFDSAVLQPLLARQRARRAELAGKAEATRVQFFTLATMRE